MHVYENECNYNAIMKAAGISELKYYKETGGDLFVQEAGAAGGLPGVALHREGGRHDAKGIR